MSNATRTPRQALADAIKSGAVQAWIDGNPIEQRWSDNETWMKGAGNASFTNPDAIWRPAPTPRLRPWKPVDVPVGAITKAHGDELSASMIVGYSEQGVFLAQDNGAYPFGELLRFRKHSLDGGKTWAPCGVQEGGE